jgi:hypothetical protein
MEGGVRFLVVLDTHKKEEGVGAGVQEQAGQKTKKDLKNAKLVRVVFV